MTALREMNGIILIVKDFGNKKKHKIKENEMKWWGKDISTHKRKLHGKLSTGSYVCNLDANKV